MSNTMLHIVLIVQTSSAAVAARPASPMRQVLLDRSAAVTADAAEDLRRAVQHSLATKGQNTEIEMLGDECVDSSTPNPSVTRANGGIAELSEGLANATKTLFKLRREARDAKLTLWLASSPAGVDEAALKQRLAQLETGLQSKETAYLTAEQQAQGLTDKAAIEAAAAAVSAENTVVENGLVAMMPTPTPMPTPETPAPTPVAITVATTAAPTAATTTSTQTAAGTEAQTGSAQAQAQALLEVSARGTLQEYRRAETTAAPISMEAAEAMAIAERWERAKNRYGRVLSLYGNTVTAHPDVAAVSTCWQADGDGEEGAGGESDAGEGEAEAEAEGEEEAEGTGSTVAPSAFLQVLDVEGMRQLRTHQRHFAFQNPDEAAGNPVENTEAPEAYPSPPTQAPIVAGEEVSTTSSTFPPPEETTEDTTTTTSTEEPGVATAAPTTAAAPTTTGTTTADPLNTGEAVPPPTPATPGPTPAMAPTPVPRISDDACAKLADVVPSYVAIITCVREFHFEMKKTVESAKSVQTPVPTPPPTPDTPPPTPAPAPAPAL